LNFSSKSGRTKSWLFYSGIIISLLFLVAAIIYIGGASENPLKENIPSSVRPHSDKKAEFPEKLCPDPLQWNIGTRQMYDYETDTEITLDSSVLTGRTEQKTKVRVTVKGILNFRIFGGTDNAPDTISARKKIVYAGFQFSPIEVTVYGETDSVGKRASDIEKLYQTFFVAAFVKDGYPVLFYFPELPDEKDKASLSEMVKIIQIIIPSDDDLPKERIERGFRWNGEETHSAGKFKAEYSVYRDDCSAVNKKNILCLSLLPVKGHGDDSKSLRLTGHIVESDFKAVIVPEVSWLKECFGTEIFEIRAKGSVWSRSRVNVNLKLRHFDPDPNLAIWKESRSAKEIVKSFINSEKKNDKNTGVWEERRLEGLAEKFKNLSVSQLMMNIKESLISGADQSALAALTHTLRDFLELYPEEAISVPDLLKKMDLSGTAAGSVLLALELVGHPQAQTALKNVFEDNEQKPDNRLRAIVAAGGIANPEQELIESLFKMAEAGRKEKNDDDLERADTSLLNLGILSHALSAGEKASESHINERIIRVLKNSEDERERIICLKALGNTSDQGAIKILEPYLESESASERAASAGSLRNFSDEYSLQLLVNSMEKDSDPGVRKGAISALADRGGIDAVESVRRRLPDETDAYLRRMMIQFLGKNKTPVVVETLKKQLEVETSGEAAKDIYRALYEKQNEPADRKPSGN